MYLKCLAKERTSLLKICNLVVADAYFSKAPFVNGLVKLGFNIVSRFRNDVRFQIEFLLRDAKKFIGLTHCQSRKKTSIEFAFNMSQTAINVARAFARDNDLDLSVANVKTLVHNAMLMQRFLSMSAMPRKRILNSNDFKELL